jgi:Protein of unknown function (DUF3995)
VLAIAGVHAYWGCGGIWPAPSTERLARAVVGTPGIQAMPSAPACFAVAIVLAGVGAWPLFAAGIIAEPWPHRLTSLAGAAIASVFVGRGVAGYTSAWRRRFGERPFASLDRLACSPLCLLLDASYIALLL